MSSTTKESDSKAKVAVDDTSPENNSAEPSAHNGNNVLVQELGMAMQTPIGQATKHDDTKENDRALVGEDSDSEVNTSDPVNLPDESNAARSDESSDMEPDQGKFKTKRNEEKGSVSSNKSYQKGLNRKKHARSLNRLTKRKTPKGDLLSLLISTALSTALSIGKHWRQRKLERMANRVENLSDRFESMSDEELVGMTAYFRRRYKRGETLDELLPEAFAAVREASGRALGMRHFPVQLMGGVVLHRGKIGRAHV